MTDANLPDLALLDTLYRGGVRDPVDVMRQCRLRIAEYDDEINAVVTLDADRAERAAQASAGRWRRGAPLSAIDGAPVLVKANFAVAGLPWHGGIAAYADRIAPTDAWAVARLRAAGAVILGLTNMDEGALGAAGDNAWLGRIGNPHRPGASAGGSSGGSAAAVAAGFCVAALGSDTIGSVAIPAAYCRVVGHRASRDLMPVAGVMPLSPSFDHGGWHTKSTRDALVMRNAMGFAADTAVPHRLAVLDHEPGRVGAVAASVEHMRSCGWMVDRVALPVSLADIARRLFEVAETQGAVVHREALDDRPEGFSPALRRMLAWGAGKGSDKLADHLAALARAAVAVRAALAGYDALLLPAAPHAAFAAGAPPPADQALFAALPACLGWPATTIPAGGEEDLALLVTAPSDDMCLTVADRLSGLI